MQNVKTTIAASIIALSTVAQGATFATTATVATTVGVSMLSATPAHALECKSVIVGTGESAGAVAKFRKRRALRRAKSEWVKQVKIHFGSKFANLSNAEGDKDSCTLTKRGNTRCVIRATPCG